MTQLLVATATRQVLAYGWGLTALDGQRVVDYQGAITLLGEAGDKYLQADGTLTLTPPGDTTLTLAPPPAAVKQAWQQLSTAAQTDPNFQAIRVLFKYVNSQLQ